ncbi:hypothetical protein ABTM48_20215, partial [Acinetobacter baumannii]
MSGFDPNRTVIGGPQHIDPNRTAMGAPGLGRTQAMSAPPTVGDPNRTTSWAPQKPVSVTV